MARVITLFPEVFPGVLGASLTGKALQEGLWRLETFDLRGFGEGRHLNVDDTPAGGGAGMVLRADIVARALRAAAEGAPADRVRWPVIYLSPRGRPFTQAMAQRLAQTEGMTLLCGRFEGVDERAIEHFGLGEISIGDYVVDRRRTGRSGLDRRHRPAYTPRAWESGVGRGEPSRPVCLNTRTIPNPPSGRVARYRRCFSPATTRRSPTGGGTRPKG